MSLFNHMRQLVHNICFLSLLGFIAILLIRSILRYRQECESTIRSQKSNFQNIFSRTSSSSLDHNGDHDIPSPPYCFLTSLPTESLHKVVSLYDILRILLSQKLYDAPARVKISIYLFS